MGKLSILQVSDVHLDCAFSGVSSQEARNRLRGEQREVFRRALAPARDGRTDMVLMPGDLFEHDRVSFDTISFLRTELEALAPVPVFIAPGNHDPCVRSSCYLNLTWPENVRIFTSPDFEDRPLPEMGATVSGIANSGAEDTRRPLDGFNAEGAGRKIGVMHGSCLDDLPPGFGGVRCLPFTSDELARAGFDYVALGHYHSFRRFPSCGQPIACYSGCLQSTGFDETGMTGSILVELGDDEVMIRQISSDARIFRTVSLDLGYVETTEQVVDALREYAEQGNSDGSVVRVRLTGDVSPGLDLRLEEIRERAAADFFYLAVDGSGLRDGHDLDALARQDTVAGSLVREFRARLESVPDGSRERRVLERALLYALDALFGREVRQG